MSNECTNIDRQNQRNCGKCKWWTCAVVESVRGIFMSNDGRCGKHTKQQYYLAFTRSDSQRPDSGCMKNCMTQSQRSTIIVAKKHPCDQHPYDISKTSQRGRERMSERRQGGRASRQRDFKWYYNGFFPFRFALTWRFAFRQWWRGLVLWLIINLFVYFRIFIQIASFVGALSNGLDSVSSSRLHFGEIGFWWDWRSLRKLIEDIITNRIPQVPSKAHQCDWSRRFTFQTTFAVNSAREYNDAG